MCAVDFPNTEQFVIALAHCCFQSSLLHHKHLFLTTKLHLFNRKQLRVFKRLTSGVPGCSPAPRRSGAQQPPAHRGGSARRAAVINRVLSALLPTCALLAWAPIDHGLGLNISD